MSLIEFCKTDRQRELIKAWEDAQNNARAAALALGIHHSYVSRTVQRIEGYAAARGHAPQHDMTRVAPAGFLVKGTSTLYDRKGGIAAQWVKTRLDPQKFEEMMTAMAESMAATLPRVDTISGPEFFNEDTMAVYPLGDPHIGVLCWAMETGQDWDLRIAERSYLAAFDRIVSAAPSCKEAVIVNLGDYFHADNLENVTTRSGHHLDVDGRYAKMIDIGVIIVRRMIERALAHHESVRVINAIGNHDDTGAMWLSVCLKNTYENNPRVTIDVNPTPFHYVKFGKTFLGVHHGHTCKLDRLPGVMAADRPKEWGDSEFRYWLTGHIHHDSKKEFGGCTVESFRTLAAKDAYANAGGYRALQDIKCLVMHKEHGEIERHTVNLSMIK